MPKQQTVGIYGINGHVMENAPIERFQYSQSSLGVTASRLGTQRQRKDRTEDQSKLLKIGIRTHDSQSCVQFSLLKSEKKFLSS